MEDNVIKKYVKEYWDKNSEYYDKHGLGTEEECLQWQRDFRDIFGEQRLQILDVGTGTGFIGLNLARLGHTVTGLDFSDKMMSHARNKARKQNIPYTFILGDAEKPDFPNDSFDVVICRYLLWTLPNPNTALSNWIKVVKPGGKIMVIDGQWKPKGVRQRFCLFTLRFYSFLCTKSGLFQIRYGEDLSKVMPHFDGVPLDDLISYFKNNCMMNISSKDFTHIREIQKKNLPWFLKYAYYNDTYGVIGTVRKEE